VKLGRENDPPQLPSDVSDHVGLFDRFAGGASQVTSRAPFFAACVLLILVWSPTIFLLNFDTSQLLINTATTIITFLLVALLQNSQQRNDQATQHKLNAVARGLSNLMTHVAMTAEEPDECEHLLLDVDELQAAVGLEDRESTTKEN
jgi:low affinity Fe/Cu permease